MLTIDQSLIRCYKWMRRMSQGEQGKANTLSHIYGIITNADNFNGIPGWSSIALHGK